MPFSFQRPRFSKLTQWLRSVYNLDGVDDRFQLAYRAIDPDGDIDIEFRTGTTLPVVGTSWTIIAQNITSTSANREFGLYTNNSNALQMILGGVFSVNMGQSIEVNTTYRVTLIGTDLTFYKSGSIVLSTSFTRGAAREPAAITNIAARNVSASSWGSFYQGHLYDVKINGTLWPIDDRNYTIQLPYPSGLGSELVTPYVMENPALMAPQWTYLGNSRWQYTGNGSGDLALLSTVNLPDMAMIDYEVESYQLVSGTGGMRISPTISPSTFFGDRLFDSVGKKRAFYLVKPNGISFTRNNAGTFISCIIKNISIKSLGTCNPITMVNTTSDRWQEV